LTGPGSGREADLVAVREPALTADAASFGSFLKKEKATTFLPLSDFVLAPADSPMCRSRTHDSDTGSPDASLQRHRKQVTLFAYA
jgi:hypothetical protein